MVWMTLFSVLYTGIAEDLDGQEQEVEGERRWTSLLLRRGMLTESVGVEISNELLLLLHQDAIFVG